MGLKLKMVLVAMVAGALAFGLGAAASAKPKTCTGDPVLNLPALNVTKDPVTGLHCMDLPAIGSLREPAPTKAPVKNLPKTGVNAGDMAAVGAAALAGGSVLLRRMRLAVS